MGKLFLILGALWCFPPLIQAQTSYQLIDSTGNPVTWEAVSQLAATKDFVLFGELHEQEAAHLAELECLEALHEQYPGRILLGMEMFEADVQPIVNEYFADLINQRSFESEARIWKNYQRDYRPLVEFAKNNQIQLLASNVPRRYANAVYHAGITVLDSLSHYARQFLPPLPLEIDTNISIYQEMSGMIPGHDSRNMIQSQGLKDATMAHFIINSKTDNDILLHLNGAYHSKNKEGIPSFLYLQGVDPHRILLIECISQDDFVASENHLADFTVIIPTPDDSSANP